MGFLGGNFMDFTYYIIDIAIVVFTAYIVWSSARKGFVLSVLELISFFASSIAASRLCRPVADWFYSEILSDSVVKLIEERLPADAAELTDISSIAVVFESLPEYFKSLLETAGISLDQISKTLSSIDLSASSVAEELANKFAQPILTALLSGVFFILLFILFSSLLRVFIRLINKFFKLPVLKTANKLLGAILGVAKSAIFVYVICTGISLLASLSTESKFSECIYSSVIVSFITDKFPLIK